MIDCRTARDDVHATPDDAAVQAHLAACPRCAAYAERFARLDQVARAALVLPAPAALTHELAAIADPMTHAPHESPLEAALRAEVFVPAPVELSERLMALATPERAPVSRTDVVLRESLVLRAPPDLTARLQTLVPQPDAVMTQPVPARPQRWVVATVYFVTAALLMLSLTFAGQFYGLLIAQLGLQAWIAQVAALPADLLNQLYAYVPQARTVVGALVQLQQPLQWILVALVLWAVIDMTQRQRQTAHQYV
jgi:predicted anti-sigma-YlaC factor YlaD